MKERKASPSCGRRIGRAAENQSGEPAGGTGPYSTGFTRILYTYHASAVPARVHIATRLDEASFFSGLGNRSHITPDLLLTSASPFYLGHGPRLYLSFSTFSPRIPSCSPSPSSYAVNSAYGYLPCLIRSPLLHHVPPRRPQPRRPTRLLLLITPSLFIPKRP